MLGHVTKANSRCSTREEKIHSNTRRPAPAASCGKTGGRSYGATDLEVHSSAWHRCPRNNLCNTHNFGGRKTNVPGRRCKVFARNALRRPPRSAAAARKLEGVALCTSF